MADITEGQALALGNLAKPDTTKVFTQAAMNKQRMNLAEKAAKAKQAEEERKIRKDMESKIKLDTKGFDPLFQEDARMLATDYFVKAKQAADAGDGLALNAYTAQANSALANLQKENEQFRNTLTDMERSGISNAEISKLLNLPKREAVAYYEQLRQNKPEVEAIVGFDPNTGKFGANYIKNLEFDKEINNVLPRLKEASVPMLNKSGKQEYTQVGNKKFYKWQVTPEAAEQEANLLISDRDGVYNAMVKYPKQYQDNYAKIQQQLEAQGQQMPPEEVKLLAAKETVKNQILELGKYKTEQSDWRPRAPKGDFNINFGGRALDYDVNGLPRADKINIKVKTKDGEQKRQVSTGNFYGFKPVEILNTKTDGVVDIETNEPVTLAAGNTFDLLKVGDASAMPIATKSFTTKSGVTYKKGQVVDDKAVAGLTQDGLVEYQPMIKGQVTYKVGDYSQTKSVVIPANNISRSVLISAGSTDVEPTSESINLAIKEAREMTDNLRKRKKISGQPTKSEVSKLDRALEAFSKQVGRQPTEKELAKLKEKYK